jgi:hypothetical protein
VGGCAPTLLTPRHESGAGGGRFEGDKDVLLAWALVILSYNAVNNYEYFGFSPMSLPMKKTFNLRLSAANDYRGKRYYPGLQPPVASLQMNSVLVPVFHSTLPLFHLAELTVVTQRHLIFAVVLCAFSMNLLVAAFLL